MLVSSLYKVERQIIQHTNEKKKKTNNGPENIAQKTIDEAYINGTRRINILIIYLYLIKLKFYPVIKL
jgi:hypothetical protein